MTDKLIFKFAIVNGNSNFDTLVDFSLGKIDAESTISLLGLTGIEDLFLLMTRYSLPMPRLSEETTRNMTNSLHKLIF